MPGMRIAYAGTPEFAVPALQALAASGHQVLAVISQPDRRIGRGQKLGFSPVKQAALDLGLPVLQPSNINSEESLAQLKALNLDLMVVAAYGQLFSNNLLTLPRHGCINIHASLLPRWRGASPIHHAILADDHETGISIMQMVKRMDAGAVWAMGSCAITSADNSQTLHDKLLPLCGPLLLQAMERVSALDVTPIDQDEADAVYCGKMKKEDGLVDWTLPASEIERRQRAYYPWPGCYTILGSQRLGLTRVSVAASAGTEESKVSAGTILGADAEGILVQTGEQCLRILELVPAGKKQMTAAQFSHSRSLQGESLGDV
ncbi:MAG: methionyl-tRNA formyltransferase [Gammaproteobacteria bacterium]|jgi:methionyl-tRNA formyltransferase|nr:methionyl-tRNA formyltransferase [Gammaproteobacteria bacterium]